MKTENLRSLVSSFQLQVRNPLSKRRIIYVLLLFIIYTSSCKKSSVLKMTTSSPADLPIENLSSFIADTDIVHRGQFQKHYEEFYFTTSSKDYSNFRIRKLVKEKGDWKEEEVPSLNSKYDEHGFSFSEDGREIYFASTRPTRGYDVGLWKIWRSKMKSGVWQEAEQVVIPSQDELHQSHPSISKKGNLYFHASAPDYSAMKLYKSEKVADTYAIPTELDLLRGNYIGACTPYISPNEKFLIFAGIGDQLELNISF